MAAARRNRVFARFAAPAAFLLAATIAVLLVRSALHAAEPAGQDSGTPAAATTSNGGKKGQAGDRPARRTNRDRNRQRPQGVFYTVQPGDTLDSIATDHGTSVERLLELNAGIDPRDLRVNQRIRVR